MALRSYACSTFTSAVTKSRHCRQRLRFRATRRSVQAWRARTVELATRYFLLISGPMAHTPSHRPHAAATARFSRTSGHPIAGGVHDQGDRLGALFGLIFGASTVYLGLRAGLTVSASIPIAVLAISVLKRLGGSTILENNIVQTIGSAGESVAAGVVFTIPALIFLAAGRARLFQLLPDHAARLRRRHPRRADDGAAAPRADREGARRAALSRKAPRAPTCSSPASAAASWRRRCSWGWASARCGSRCRGSSSSSAPRSATRSPRTRDLPERDAERRHLARIHGRRLRDRPAHRRRHVRRRRAVVARAAAAALDHGQLHDRSVPAGSRPAACASIEMSPGQIWSAYIRYIGAGAVLAAGIITLAPHAADDRLVVPRQREGLRRANGRRRTAPHRARHPDDDRAGRLAAARALPGVMPGCRRRATSWPSVLSSSSASSSSPSRRASPGSSARRRTRSRA